MVLSRQQEIINGRYLACWRATTVVKRVLPRTPKQSRLLPAMSLRLSHFF